MKLKLKDLNDVKRAFGTVLSKEIPVKLAYQMRKFSGKVMSEFKHLDTANNELIKKYGDPVKENPQQLQVPPERMETYLKEYAELLELEVDLGDRKIPFECLEAMGTISPAHMVLLEEFIADPLPSKPKLAKAQQQLA